MLDLIEKVMYKIKNLPYSDSYFMLEITQNGNILGYKDNMKIIKKENIDDKIIEEYLDKLIRVIDDWKEKYENQNVIDGTVWDLQVNFKDGTKKYYTGKNNFPYNFEYLNRLNNELINKIEEN